jgi:hypothetical protein
MTPNRFNEIVKNRANQRVKQKIAKFEAAVAQAFKDLHPCLTSNDGNKWFGGSATEHVKPVLRHLIGVRRPDKPTGYPACLWADEEDKVQQELLATMDEMSRALLAEQDTEPRPIATDVDSGTEFAI